MTPEEMGAALGAGWGHNGITWVRRIIEVGRCSGGEGWNVYRNGKNLAYDLPIERAVAVARLLVAAEETAAGGPPPRLCGEDCATEREMAEERGRMVERRRVVAWLRRQIGWSHPGLVAAGIERGEHWVGHRCKGERCDGEDRDVRPDLLKGEEVEG